MLSRTPTLAKLDREIAICEKNVAETEKRQSNVDDDAPGGRAREFFPKGGKVPSIYGPSADDPGE